MTTETKSSRAEALFAEAGITAPAVGPNTWRATVRGLDLGIALLGSRLHLLALVPNAIPAAVAIAHSQAVVSVDRLPHGVRVRSQLDVAASATDLADRIGRMLYAVGVVEFETRRLADRLGWAAQ